MINVDATPTVIILLINEFSINLTYVCRNWPVNMNI